MLQLQWTHRLDLLDAHVIGVDIHVHQHTLMFMILACSLATPAPFPPPPLGMDAIDRDMTIRTNQSN